MVTGSFRVPREHKAFEFGSLLRQNYLNLYLNEIILRLGPAYY